MTAATTPLGNSREDAAKAGLSIIVPVYNEASGLAALHERIAGAARDLRRAHGLGCEVVYVDDGSSDDSLAVARRLPADGIDVQVVSLSRNFGKEAALMAGLDHARRGAVLFMDADGQHPPALIGRLIGHWLNEGYDVVYTAKASRTNESALRRLGGKSFYTLINWGARQKIPQDAGDFRLLSPRATAALRQLPERNRFFKGLATWIGFRQLRVASLLGMLLAASALLFGLWMVIEAIVYERTVPGYPSLIVSVMVIGGVQLLMIGIMGEYIGKILSEIKARPVYFVAEHSVKTAGEDSARAAAE